VNTDWTAGFAFIALENKPHALKPLFRN